MQDKQDIVRIERIDWPNLGAVVGERDAHVLEWRNNAQLIHIVLTIDRNLIEFGRAKHAPGGQLRSDKEG